MAKPTATLSDQLALSVIQVRDRVRCKGNHCVGVVVGFRPGVVDVDWARSGKPCVTAVHPTKLKLVARCVWATRIPRVEAP